MLNLTHLVMVLDESEAKTLIVKKDTLQRLTGSRGLHDLTVKKIQRKLIAEHDWITIELESDEFGFIHMSVLNGAKEI